jgi:general secretion pathway protein D
MVLNNQTANLQVGDEVPVVTQTAQSVVDNNAPIVSAVQLRETGVILEVKPRINASDVVVLEITQEVSDVAETTTSGIDSPTIQQRKFTSTVAVKNNGTVALGGLIRETYSDNESGLPLLKDIPGIGYAFKSRDIKKRRTELIIFLTPRIIRTDADAQNAIHFIRREMDRLGANESSLSR